MYFSLSVDKINIFEYNVITGQFMSESRERVILWDFGII